MTDRVVGWCAKHYFLIYHEKFHSKCKCARKGKMCKSFEYKIPEWAHTIKRGGVDG